MLVKTFQALKCKFFHILLYISHEIKVKYLSAMQESYTYNNFMVILKKHSRTDSDVKWQLKSLTKVKKALVLKIKIITIFLNKSVIRENLEVVNHTQGTQDSVLKVHTWYWSKDHMWCQVLSMDKLCKAKHPTWCTISPALILFLNKENFD